MVASQRTNGNTPASEPMSAADILNGTSPSDLLPGVYGYFVVFNRDTVIPLREARRNTANNAMPDGVTRDKYSTTIGKSFNSVVEELTRYHGHILNNQAESAMIAGKKAADAAKTVFDRTAALHKWRMEKIDEIESATGLGVRAASVPALPLRDRMERDEAFKMLRGAAVKGGQGSTFPDRLTVTTLKQVVSKGRTLEAMIIALLATPVSGGAIKKKVDELIEQQNAELDTGDAELDALFAAEPEDEGESEDEGEDEDEGEAPTPPPAA